MPDSTITRIDLKNYPNEGGIRVAKYADGWTIGGLPREHYTTDTMSLDEMIAWLKAAGWDVIEWKDGKYYGLPDGARAWKGPRKPVRKKSEILY